MASVPAGFQRTTDSILQCNEGVVCYIDDVLISPSTREEHLKRLELVLQRLQQHGVRARREKCKSLSRSVEFLGYSTDVDGHHPLQSKVNAIQNAPVPKIFPWTTQLLWVVYS